MPKNLTDVSQFPTVAVPVGTDPATAASVEAPLQLLADRTRYLLRSLLGARAANWSQSDISDITGGTFCSGANVMAICYDPDEDRFWAIDDDGAVVCTIPASYASPPATPGGGPHLWYDDTSDPLDNTLWTASGAQVDIAAGAGAVVGVSSSAAGQIASSGGFAGTWAARTPASGGVLWGRVTFDPASSLFIVAGTSGTPVHVETSPDGTTWTDRSVAAGFSVNAESPQAIASDPAGVAGTLILSDSEFSHTLDGLTFSKGSHSLATVPLALAYAGGGRWVAVLTSGDVAYSEDNGATWTAVTTPLDGFVATYVHIAADGRGGLVASAASAARSLLWASIDSGETWETVYQAGMIDAMESGPCYGGGHYAAIGCLSGGTVAAIHSLRVLEA